MKNVLVALSAVLALSGCLKSSTQVSSGKFATVIPDLIEDQNGTIVPLGVQASISYLATFYNYQNPSVANGQNVFAMGDGGLMIYGSDFSDDSSTTVIFRNAATLQEVTIPASQFTVSSNQMQMKTGYVFPSNLPGAGLYSVHVKNTNSNESNGYQIMVTGTRPKLEYRLVTNEDVNHHLTSSSPIVNPTLRTEVLLSTNDVNGNGIIPNLVYVEVKNSSSVSIDILQANFLQLDGNSFYTYQTGSGLVLADITSMFASNFWNIVSSYGWPSNTSFCNETTQLAAGQKCYLALSINGGLSTGPIHDDPNCYNFVWKHGIQFQESSSLNLPPKTQTLDVRGKAYLNSVPIYCGGINNGGGGNGNNQS